MKENPTNLRSSVNTKQDIPKENHSQINHDQNLLRLKTKKKISK